MKATRADARFARALMVALTLMAVLIGVVAMHSMMGGHNGADASGSHAHGASPHEDTMTSMTAAGASAARGAGTDDRAELPLIPCTDGCASCALMAAATCVIVFLVAGLLFVARAPAVFARVLEAGPRVIPPPPRALLHLSAPSLTVLSISRT